MENKLGYCTQQNANGNAVCGGDLHVSGSQIRCVRCGGEVTDHPLLRPDPHARPYQVPRDVQPIDMVATVPDRVNTLEKIVREMGERLQRAEGKAAALEAQLKRAKQ